MFPFKDYGSENDDDFDEGNDEDQENDERDHVTPVKEVERVDVDKKHENTHEEIANVEPANIEQHKKECGTNHGCDHKCTVALDETGADNGLECSCHIGYTLDTNDGRTCHGESLQIHLITNVFRVGILYIVKGTGILMTGRERGLINA